MRLLKLSLLFAILLSFTIIYLSCDDSGIINNNKVDLTFSNLQRLDPQLDGLYEGWVSFPDIGYISIGKFNISSAGIPVDTNGNPLTFKLKYQVEDINTATGGLITIVPPGGVDTFGTKFLAGPKSSNENYILFNVSMESDSILGWIASQFPYDNAQYMICNPTDTSHLGTRGLWFTKDINGTSKSITIAGLWGKPWTYQAWVIDTVANMTYNIGRFDDADHGDDYHQCEGNNPEFDKPGNDWVQPNCPGGMPSIVNLNAGKYKVMITLEPKNDINWSPFFIRLFYGTIMVSAPGVVASIPNVTALPTAVIQVSKN
jgi:hypothetical protein